MKWISTLLVVAYPMLAHAAVWFSEPRLQWLALLALGCIPLLPALLRGRLWAWALFALLGVALYLLIVAGGGFLALVLPSVLIPALLGGVFGSSLRGGRVDTITRMADATRESMTPALRAYTRRLTQLWTALFALMALGSLSLALLGEAVLWSWWSNGVTYVLCALMFVGDHLYRRWRFRSDAHPGFVEFLRIVARADLRRT